MKQIKIFNRGRHCGNVQEDFRIQKQEKVDLGIDQMEDE